MSVLHRAVYYAQSGIVSPPHSWLAANYAEAVVSVDYADPLKLANPNFLIDIYNSGTDDYTYDAQGNPIADGLRVKRCAEALGVDPESMYLHWMDGTRVEVYHVTNGPKRHLCAFMPTQRPVQTKAMLEVAETPTPGGRAYDGIWLDNSSNHVWNIFVVGNGVVQECGLAVSATAFHDWYWMNFRDWLIEFRTALRRLSKPRLLTINISVGWTDEFCTHPVADRLFREFCENPIKETWPGVAEIARRHVLAEENGTAIWASAAVDVGSPVMTWHEMLYAILCQHLVVRRKSSSIHLQDRNGPWTPDWDQRIVSPVESNPNFKLLGNPTGDPFPVLKGKTPRGTNYEVFERDYERGAVLCRPRIPYNGATDDVVTIPTPWNMIFIDADGTTPQPRPDDIVIKNGGGAIFIRP